MKEAQFCSVSPGEPGLGNHKDALCMRRTCNCKMQQAFTNTAKPTVCKKAWRPERLNAESGQRLCWYLTCMILSTLTSTASAALK